MPMPAAMNMLERLRAAELALPGIDTLDVSLLPDGAQELARLIGLPRTLALVDRLGGCTIRVPNGVTRQGMAIIDELAKIVGRDNADKLVAEYASTALYIPNCKQSLVTARNAALVHDRDLLAAQGMGERDIVFLLALRYHISDRYIWTLLKRPMPEPLKENTRDQRQARLI